MDVYTDELSDYYKNIQKNLGYRKPGQDNPASILSEEDVMNIRRMYVNYDRNYIFKQYPQYSQRTITSIISGQN